MSEREKPQTPHDDSREHALEQVRALCAHAILGADQYAQGSMTAAQREEICRLLIDGGAHLELVVRIDGSHAMHAELRLVEFGKPTFPEPLLKVETKGGKSA
jgi:hypothetical protein